MVDVQVFIYDPLYRMSLSAAAASHRQQSNIPGVENTLPPQLSSITSPLRNADAERVLLRVRQKLEGREAGDCPVPSASCMSFW